MTRTRYHDQIAADLVAQGFALEAAQALVAFDVENFAYMRRVKKGDVPKSLAEEAGVTLEPLQFHALGAIARLASGFGPAGPADVTVGLLAEEMQVDASRASRIAADLVDKGLIARAVSQEDGRRAVLVPTEAGYALLQAFLRAKWRRWSLMFRDWSAEDLQALARLFRRYNEGMREIFPAG